MKLNFAFLPDLPGYLAAALYCLHEPAALACGYYQRWLLQCVSCFSHIHDQIPYKEQLKTERICFDSWSGREQLVMAGKSLQQMKTPQQRDSTTGHPHLPGSSPPRISGSEFQHPPPMIHCLQLGPRFLMAPQFPKIASQAEHQLFKCMSLWGEAD